MPEAKGILGTKLGMTQIFTEDSRAVPVTVIQAGPCIVTQVKTLQRDGYEAIQLAFAEMPRGKANKPEEGHAAAAGTKPHRYLVEMRTDGQAAFEPGQEIKADIFSPGDHADVVGVSKGHGFAGTMKRHGFGGLGASHGTQAKHRSPGSIGACATPGRVFKGVRMAGRMGNVRFTAQSLTIQAIEPEQNLILVRGAIPGPKGGLVLIRTAAKSKAKAGASK